MDHTELEDQSTTRSPTINARLLLLPYVLGLAAACALLQLFIVINGNRIGLGAQLLTGVVAIYYATYLILRRHELGKVRFARLVAHAATYAIVNGSFQLHAAILAIAGSDVLRGDDYLPIDEGWFGPTLAMAGFWAVGLTIHSIASIAQRGFEA